MKHKMKSFTGTITQVSSSPHGFPEGVLLDTGLFVKIPPHTLINDKLIREGSEMSGTAEIHSYKLNKSARHARVFINDELVADDQLDEHENESRKESHKKELKLLKKTLKETLISKHANVLAVCSKKHGEVERIMLSDGTSVHVPKDIDVHEEDFKIGDSIYVEGIGRDFKEMSFIRADFIMNEEGMILSI